MKQHGFYALLLTSRAPLLSSLETVYVWRQRLEVWMACSHSSPSMHLHALFHHETTNHSSKDWQAVRLTSLQVLLNSENFTQTIKQPSSNVARSEATGASGNTCILCFVDGSLNPSVEYSWVASLFARAPRTTATANVDTNPLPRRLKDFKAHDMVAFRVATCLQPSWEEVEA